MVASVWRLWHPPEDALLAAGAWAALTRLQTAAWSLYVAFCCWYGGLAVENDPPLTLEEAEQLFRDARKDCFF